MDKNTFSAKMKVISDAIIEGREATDPHKGQISFGDALKGLVDLDLQVWKEGVTV